MIKRCPRCGSTRFKKWKEGYMCRRCGYVWYPKSAGFRTADTL